jgi:cellulose synthase/poly-beta-1,6-N-acetylglucosamine synthase-like glycosyltransferase
MSDPSTAPSLAVVIPATDAPPTLARCVAAVRAAAPGAELIVQLGPTGAGPAAARNAGAARTEADVIAFVDADVIVHSDALVRLHGRLAADPHLAAAFGAYDDRPAAPGAVSRFRNLLHHHVHVTAAGPAETFWAGLGAVRREAFDAAGGFDAEAFPAPAVEDVELGMRIRRAGREIVLDPGARGTHLKRWTMTTMVRTDFVRRGIPWARLELAEGTPSRSLNLSLRHRLSALASVGLAAALLARRGRIALAALTMLGGLNARFYALLLRRGGPSLLAAGVPLHALHHLVATAALATALVEHIAREER